MQSRSAFESSKQYSSIHGHSELEEEELKMEEIESEEKACVLLMQVSIASSLQSQVYN